MLFSLSNLSILFSNFSLNLLPRNALFIVPLKIISTKSIKRRHLFLVVFQAFNLYSRFCFGSQTTLFVQTFFIRRWGYSIFVHWTLNVIVTLLAWSIGTDSKTDLTDLNLWGVPYIETFKTFTEFQLLTKPPLFLPLLQHRNQTFSYSWNMTKLRNIWLYGSFWKTATQCCYSLIYQLRSLVLFPSIIPSRFLCLHSSTSSSLSPAFIKSLLSFLVSNPVLPCMVAYNAII